MGKLQSKVLANVIRKMKILVFFIAISGYLVACSAQTDEQDSEQENMQSMDVEYETGTGEYGSEEMEEKNSSSEEMAEYDEVEVSQFAKWCMEFSESKAWVLGQDDVWYLIDTNGNITYTLPSGLAPATNFMNGICLVKRQGTSQYCNYAVIDENGHLVLKDYLTDNDSVIMLERNGDSVDLWVKTVVDTYEKHEVVLKVIDENGNIKAEFYPNDAMSEYTMTQLNETEQGLFCAGDGIYYDRYGAVFDVETSNSYFIDPRPNELYLAVEGDYFVDGKNNLRDRGGNIVIAGNTDMTAATFSEGMYYIGEMYQENWSHWAVGRFFDAKGEIVLDLTQIKIVTTSYHSYYSMRSMTLPIFKNGYCLMTIANESGVNFVTVMDKNGQFSFEPIKGETQMAYVEDDMFAMETENGKMIWVDMNGIQYELPSQIAQMGYLRDGWAVYADSKSNILEQGNGYINKNGELLMIKIPITNQ